MPRHGVCRLWLCGLVTAAVSASAAAVPTASAQVVRGWPDGCPASVRAEFGDPSDFVAVAEAIRSQVPRVYADLFSMGHPAWHRVEVVGLFNLGGPPPGTGVGRAIGGLGYYLATATHACGKMTAERSFLAFLWFPDCQMVCAPSFAFLTPTRRGWYLWTSFRL